MKKDNRGYIVLGVMALAGGYLIYDTFIKKQPTQTDPNQQKDPVSQPVTYSYPIVFGKYHPDVKRIQTIVGTNTDGVIGPKTVAAIQRYFPWFTKDSIINTLDELIQMGYIIVQRQNG